MSIIKYSIPTSSYGAFPTLLGSNVFADFFSNGQDLDVLRRKSTQGYPVADIFTDDKQNTILQLALAGLNKEDIKIEVCNSKQSITISHHSKEEGVEGQRRIARRSFEKTYVNPEGNLDLELSTAKFENGLLTVTIPRSTWAKSLTIKID